jgi:hypothetical protein
MNEMKQNRRETDYELEYYLWELDASKAERYCARMWVRDGHLITENDHYKFWGDYPMDFLTASREESLNWHDYTDSFYDVKTQAYIHRQNLTKYEMKKLREYRRSGGRFCDEWMNDDGFDNYITFLHDHTDICAAMFDDVYSSEIARYFTDFLACRNLMDEFVDFIKEREKSDQMTFSFEEDPARFGIGMTYEITVDELPF